MSKSFWLLSAGLTALATPAYAQNDQTTTGTASGTENAAVQHDSSEPDIVITAQGRRQILQDVPLAVTAVGGDAAPEQRRQRHPPAEPARAVAARLLDRHRGERLGPYPRHRHGRRQSRPRKLGRGVHRRRLPLAQRHRPQRARRGRADRGAARPAGHLVRPQRLGRPHPHHHPPAGIRRFRRLCRADLRQLQPDPRRRRDQRAARRDARRPARRGLCPPRRLLSRRQPDRRHRGPGQRPRPHLRARPIAVRAERRALVPADRRLYQSQRILLRRRLSRPRDSPLDRQPQQPGEPPPRRRRDQPRRQQHHQRPARSRPAAGRVQQSLQPDDLRQPGPLL